MKFPRIKYTAGWEYVLKEDILVETGILPEKVIHHQNDFILHSNGVLQIYEGYPWDGATGGFDTKNSMVASLVHDCFCEMMRTGELEYTKYSESVHNLLGDIAEEHGMSSWRANAWRWVTKMFQGGHPTHPEEHPILEAP